MTLGEQIKQAREQKNLSQEELAEYLGVSRQAVSKWENDTSVPQGTNRELLTNVLALDLMPKEETPQKHKHRLWLGWILALLFLIVSVCLCINHGTESGGNTISGSTMEDGQSAAAFKSIRFYDSDEIEVSAQALWYNTAYIESILLQWEEGEPPQSIKIFSTPSGSETTEETELLLTKALRSNDSAILLSADVLKDIVFGHVVFALDYGENMVKSDIYNMLYDPELPRDAP